MLHWLSNLGRLKESPRPDREGYDALDEVLIGILRPEEPGEVALQRSPEIVPYQPTPARHVFDLLERIALTQDDVLIDIGSGLGHVPILTAIWTGACSVGIELEPAYVACAQRSAESLGLANVSFIQQDARAADFSSGTVFYLYTPFTGAMLRGALDLLREQAERRAIRVCTYGPCTRLIATENWLEGAGEARPDRVAVFRSCLVDP